MSKTDPCSAGPEKQCLIIHHMSYFSAFWAPVAVKVDDNGRVIIADTSRHRFQVYQKNTEPVLV